MSEREAAISDLILYLFLKKSMYSVAT